ncbi:MAG: DUF4406 domain-containing protein [Flavobacteriales bacterium]|nr:MAG: DUF4406 domain-containing protein [Flavobacteriales bacterium]
MTENQRINNGFEVLFTEVVKNHNRFTDALTMLKLDNQLVTVYIAGKVTGLPYDAVKKKFDTRKAELIEKGYIVINPCDYIEPDANWITAMAICMQLLPLANAMSLLPDWQDSQGATWERETAIKYGISILPE